MPDLNDLDAFDQGLPAMDLLPPSEIRRRGDRLRRRRTALVAAGGVLAVAVAIGTPVIALSGGGGPGRVADPPIATSPALPPTEPAAGWVTGIPDGFPLTDGFADENATPNDGLAQDPSLALECGSEGFRGFTDSAVVTYQGESEDREVRILVVYPDAAAAEAELAALRASINTCGPIEQPTGTSIVHEPVDAELGTDESFAFSQQVVDDDLVSQLSLFLLGRTGNAIYVDHSYGSVGGEAQVAAEVQRLTANSAVPLAAMCAFAIEPCP